MTHWKRLWFWGRLKAGGEGDDRGWDRWMASLTLWTWVWGSSGDGQGSLVFYSPWGRKESDTTEWLNWTEPLLLIFVNIWNIFYATHLIINYVIPSFFPVALKHLSYYYFIFPIISNSRWWCDRIRLYKFSYFKNFFLIVNQWLKWYHITGKHYIYLWEW